MFINLKKYLRFVIVPFTFIYIICSCSLHRNGDINNTLVKDKYFDLLSYLRKDTTDKEVQFFLKELGKYDSISIEDKIKEIIYLKKGISIMYSIAGKKILRFKIYGRSNTFNYVPYPYQIPFKLKNTDTKESIDKKIGIPWKCIIIGENKKALDCSYTIKEYRFDFFYNISSGIDNPPIDVMFISCKY